MTIEIPASRRGDEVEEYQNLQPTPTLNEQLKTGFELGLEDTAVGSLGLRSALRDMEERTKDLPKLDPKELNRKYPDMPRPFEKPMNEQVAFYLHDRFLDRQKKQQIIARGISGSNFPTTRKVLNFAAGVVPSVLDPIEFTLGMVGGFAISKGAAMLAKGAVTAQRATAVTRIANNLAKSPLKSEFIGDLGANALAEASILNTSKQELRDYTVMDAFTNAVAGATLSLALKASFRGIKKLRDKFDKSSPINAKRHMETNMSEQQIKDANVTAINQKLSGAEVDVNPIIHRTQRLIEAGPHRYEFQDINAANISERDFFYSNRAQGIGDDRVFHVGEDIGDGIYFSDNQNVANARQKTYRSARFEKVTNFFNMERPLDKIELGQAKKILGKDLPRHTQVKDAPSLKELYTHVKNVDPENAVKKINEMNDLIRDKWNWDGLKHVDEIDLEGGKSPHNVVMLFQSDKKRPLKVKFQKKHKHMDLSQMEFQARMKEKPITDPLIDEVTEEYNKIVRETILPEGRPEIQRLETELDVEIENMKKNGFLDEDSLKALDDAADDLKVEKTKLEALRQADACLASGGE